MPQSGRKLVLDLTRLLPGPLAGRILASLGFDVLQILPPSGDLLADYAPETFAWLAVGKRRETVDLKSAAGRVRLRQLAAKAVILLENNLPGRMDAWHLGPEALRQINPSLVYVRLAGQRSSSAPALPGHDLTYLAAAGLLPHFEPAWRHLQVADLTGAFWMVLAAQQGLLAGGGFYEIYLEEAAATAAWPALPGLDGGRCCYAIYDCAEGRIALAALEPHLWERFCAAARHSDWLAQAASPARPGDPGFDPIAAFFRGRTAAEWDAWGREHALPLRALGAAPLTFNSPPWSAPRADPDPVR